jgi:hypothetical protein
MNNIDKPAAIQPTPGAFVDLTPEELSCIASMGADPADYAAVMVPSAQVGVGFTDLPGVGRALVVQAVAIIPPGLIPPDASNLIDPTTSQPKLSPRLRDAFPATWPFIVRVLTKRSSLTQSVQDRLAIVDARKEAQVIAKGIAKELTDAES